MDIVKVNNIKIGDGIPKICVPIVARTDSEVIFQAENIKMYNPDIVEFRADWYENIFNLDKTLNILNSIKKILNNIPILFTFRSKIEGGEKEILKEEYQKINLEVSKSKKVDLIDIEVFNFKDIASKLINDLHNLNVKVVASNHNFYETPSEQEIMDKFFYMQELNADILKMAVMPQSKQDVIKLLNITYRLSQEIKKPIVTMSMSKLGIISRLSGEIFGSSITFASIDKTSAPGQIQIEKLRNILEILHN